MTFLEHGYQAGRTLGAAYATLLKDGTITADNTHILGERLPTDLAQHIPREYWSPPFLAEVERGILEELNTLASNILLRDLLPTILRSN